MTIQDNTPPADPDKGKVTPPADAGTGQGDNGAGSFNVPEKFKGKSVEDIAKAYVELESAHGKATASVAEAAKLKQDTDTLIKAIYHDPDLYRQVENGIKRYVSGEELPNRDTVTKKETETPDPNAGKDNANPAVAELRIAEENRVVNTFLDKFKYNALDETSKKDAMATLATTLAEIVDPGGKRPMKEVMASIPLPKLGKFLETAHFMANKEKIFAAQKESAALSREESDGGVIGSFAAAARSSERTVKLSPAQKETARKMGIPEDRYLKRMQQIDKENL